MRKNVMRLSMWTAGVVCVGAMLMAGGCNRPSQAGSVRAVNVVPVTTRPVMIQSVPRTISVVGKLWGDVDTTVAAKVAGRVIEVYHDFGDRVKSGEKLCLIAPVDYDLAKRQKELASKEPLAKLGLNKLPAGEFDVDQVATVKKAKLLADNARAQYMRLEQLRKENPASVTEQDRDNARTTWEVAQSAYDVEKLTANALLAQAKSAQADLEVADQRLSDTLVCAPAPEKGEQGPRVRDWAISDKIVNVGEYLKEGSPVFKLVDDDLVKLRSQVIEKYVRDVKEGQQVIVESVSYDNPFVGSITRVNPQVDVTNCSFEIEAIIPNPRHELKPGGFVTGKIIIGQNPRAVFVPLESVVTFAGVSKVFTVKDGKAVEHTIELGERRTDDQRQDWVEAKQGLTGDESVVIKGASKLAEGVAVTLMREATSAPASTRPMAK